jgi:hypothetical protein
MFASAYMGRKRIFRMLSLQVAQGLQWSRVLSQM